MPERSSNIALCLLAGVLILGILLPGTASAQVVVGGRPNLAADTSRVRPLGRWLPSRQDTLRVQGGGPFLIRPFIEEGSEHVQVDGVSISDYILDRREGIISLPGIAPDSTIVLVVAYRHVPLDLASSYRLWGSAPADGAGREGNLEPNTSDDQTSVLTTRGHITRGILTGSNREARIESGLQLQVHGEVAPGITLQASLSDEDTPLVPEGVTRQFDQFDRIRIHLQSRRGAVELGDFDVVLDGTRYGVLRRTVQGAVVRGAPVAIGGPWNQTLSISSGAAISRGQFHSVDVGILDGVQGPYRLTGAAGERFILLLPGTEQVYLDGVLLERGEDQDYVVDYQLGEITFTARHVMGSERRVRVDYEYTTNRYTRTMTFSEATLGLGGSRTTPWARLTLGGIRESDGDAFLDESGLSAADSALVASSIDGTVQIDGASVVPYEAEALYTQYVRGSSPTGEPIWVELKSVPAQEQTVYRVPFTFVGSGKGTYIRIPSQGGGIAYEWAGEGMGAYAAVRTLPVPSRKSLVEVRLQILGVPGMQIETGLAVSSLDRNRLSSDPASIQQGTVSHLSIASRSLSLGRGWDLSVRGSGYLRTAQFATFERVRSVEFTRDWALPLQETNPFGSLLEGADERLSEAALIMSRTDSSSIRIGIGKLAMGPEIRSKRTHVDARLELPLKTSIQATLRKTAAQGAQHRAFLTERAYARARVSAGNESSRWRPWFELEADQWKHQGGDVPTPLADTNSANRMPYRAVGGGLGRSWRFHQLSLSGWRRLEEDVSLDQGPVLTGSRVNTVQASWEWIPGTSVRSRSSIGWRQSETAGYTEEGAPGRQDALLVELSGQARSGSIGALGWSYSARSEQTAAMQEVYIRTGPDRGHFVWQDINADGRIQLDEFFPETTPGEGEYARTLFPSDSLQSVTTAEARFTYGWVPTPASTGWRRIAMDASVDVLETTRAADRIGVYLLKPSALRVPGETVNGRIRLSGRLGLYPLRSDRDVQISWLQGASLAALASGNESTQNKQIGLILREEVRQDLDVTFASTWMDEIATSEQFATRSFAIRRWEIRPGAVIRLNNWRVQSEAMYSRGREEGTGASVRTVRLPVNVLWNTRPLRWRMGGEWSDAAVDGGAPLGLQLFELTEGRGAGTSWMWHLHLDMLLTDVLTATLRYDGRNPTGLPTIHTGRFQLSARF